LKEQKKEKNWAVKSISPDELEDVLNEMEESGYSPWEWFYNQKKNIFHVVFLHNNSVMVNPNFGGKPPSLIDDIPTPMGQEDVLTN